MPLQLSRSLQHRNFRLYFFGQLLSLLGTWMQSVAQAWLVYRLTDSSFMLGLVSFLNHAPVLLLGLFAGGVADRFRASACSGSRRPWRWYMPLHSRR
jgi:hypothetical protein